MPKPKGYTGRWFPTDEEAIHVLWWVAHEPGKLVRYLPIYPPGTFSGDAAGPKGLPPKLRKRTMLIIEILNDMVFWKQLTKHHMTIGKDTWTEWRWVEPDPRFAIPDNATPAEICATWVRAHEAT